MLILFFLYVFCSFSVKAQSTTTSRAQLTLVNPQINSITQVVVRFIHLSFDWAEGNIVTYTYPPADTDGIKYFQRDLSASFICQSSTDGTTFTTLASCSEPNSNGFQFTVPAQFMSGGNPADSYIRFGYVRVPGVVRSNYPGPTITLKDSSGTTTLGTYFGTSNMPSPEPVPLTVNFSTSNVKPGTLADYTFTITTTNDITANYNLRVQAQQTDPDKPEISFRETTTTKIEVSIQIGSGSGATVLQESQRDVDLNQISIPNFNGNTIITSGSQIILIFRNVRNPITTGQTEPMILYIENEQSQPVMWKTGLVINVVGSCELSTSETSVQILPATKIVTQQSRVVITTTLGIPYPQNEGRIIVVFPPTITISLQSKNPCLDISNVTFSAPCTVSGNSITFETYQKDGQNLALAVYYIQNPHTAGLTSSFAIRSVDNSGQTSCSISNSDSLKINFAAAPITTNFLTRSPALLNSQSATFTLSYYTTALLKITDTLKIYLPDSQAIKLSGSKCTLGGVQKQCTWTGTTPSINQVQNNTIVSTVSEWCNTGNSQCARQSTFVVTLEAAANPKWLVSPDTTNTVITFEESGGLVATTSGTSRFSPTLELTPFSSVSGSRDSTSNIVGEATSYTFNFAINTEVAAGGRIRIKFPSGAALPSSVAVSVGGVAATHTTNNHPGTSYLSEILLTQACASACTSGQTFQVVVSGLVNPGSTKPITNSFTVESFLLNGANEYFVDRTIITDLANLALVPNKFQSFSNTPATFITGDIVSYSITFQPKNAIPAGGRVLIVYPSDIELSDNSVCSANIVGFAASALTCTTTLSTRTVTLTTQSTINISDTPQITIINVVNPRSFRPSQPISITSYLVEGSNSYSIDQDVNNSNDLVLTMTQQNDLSGVQLLRIPVDSNDEVPIAGKPQTHSFAFTLYNPIPAGGQVHVSLTSEQMIISDINGITIQQLDSNGSVTGNNIVTSLTSSLLVISPCSSECSTGTIVRFQMKGANAPPTNKLPEVKIRLDTYTHQYSDTSTRYKIDYAEKDFLLPVSYGPLSSVVMNRVLPGSSTDADQVGQTIQLVTTWYPMHSVASGGRFIMKFSDVFIYETTSAPSCESGPTGSTQPATCELLEKVNDPDIGQNVVYEVRITLPSAISVASEGTVDSQQYTVKISGLQNPFNTNGAKSGAIALFTAQPNANNNSLFDSVNAKLLIPPTTDMPALSPGPLTISSITRSSATVDAPVQLTFSFTTATKVVSGHSVIFIIPRPFFEVVGDESQWSPTCDTTCSGSVSATQITLIVTNLICNSNFPCNPTSVTLKVTNGLKNAYNLATQSDTFIVRSTTQLTSVLVDEHSGVVAVTPSLTVSTTTVTALTLGSQLTGEITHAAIPFTLTSRVLSTDYLEVRLASSSSNSAVPALFTVPSGTSVSCTKVVTSSSSESALDSCIVTLSGSNIQSVRVNNFCSPSGCSSGESFSLKLSGVELPGIAQDVNTHLTVNTQTSETIGIGSGSVSFLVDIQPNIFLNPSIVAIQEGSCLSQIYHVCSLRFTLTTKNPFPIAGKLEITLPTSSSELSYLTINGGAACQNAQIGGVSSGVSCNLVSNIVTLTHNFADTAATDDKQIILDVTTLQLPTSTRPTAAFIIRTMSGIYEIDRIDTLTFSALSGSLNSPLVIRGAQKITSATEYKFSFVTTNNIDPNYKASQAYPDAALVQIIIPTDAEADFISTSGCTVTRNGALQSSVSLIIDQGASKLTISGICSSSSLCPAGTMFNVTCPSSVIRNKQWIKLDLNNITDSIQMGLRTPDTLYWFDAKVTSLFATPALLPGDLTVNSLSRSGDGNGQLVGLSATVTPQFSSHIATGNLMFHLNPGLFLDPDQAMEGRQLTSGALQPATIFKHYDGTSPLQLYRVGINNPCGNGVTCVLQSSFGYTLEFLKNPILATSMPSDPMEIFTATSQGYMLDRGYSLPLNQIFNDIAAASFKSVHIWPEDPVVGVTTPYDFVFKLTSEMPSTSWLDLHFPSTLALTSPECSDLFLTTNVNMTCSLYTNSTGTQVLRIYSIVPNATSTSTLVNGYFALKIKTFTNPSHTGAVGALYAQLHTPAGLLSQGHFTIPPAKESLTTCNEECATCAGSSDYCVTCVVPGKLPFREGTQSTCVATCTDGFFLNPLDNKCYECDDSCGTCYGHQDTQCLSCTDPTPHKVDSSCVSTCPANTFATTINGKQVCENDNSPSSCTSPCARCSSSLDFCLTCDVSTTTADTINPLTGTCVSSNNPSPHNCTTGWYPVTSGDFKECQPCYYLCNNCTERADSCLGCKPDIYLASTYSENNSTCSKYCQSGTFFGNIGCVSCNPICSECTGLLPNNCLSCNQSIPEITAPLYLYHSQCVFECPYPYTQNTSNNECITHGIRLNKSVPFFIEIPLLIAAVVFILVSVCRVASHGERFIWWNAAFALLSILEWVNRVLLLGNLFDKKYPILFAFHFMILFTTCFLGLYFHLMYLSPIIHLSLYFKNLYAKFRRSFHAVIIFAYIAGSNVFRLISSKLFRAPGLCHNLGQFTFWIRPLEIVGLFALVLSGIEILILISVMAVVPSHTDAFMCAILGLFWNVGLIILQIFTWLYMRKHYPMSRMDVEEAKLIDPQNPAQAIPQN